MAADDAADQRDLFGDRIVSAAFGANLPIVHIAAEACELIFKLQVEPACRRFRMVARVVGQCRSDERRIVRLVSAGG